MIERILTWHNHHPTDKRIKYRVSAKDTERHGDTLLPIEGYRYEILVNPYPDEGSGNLNNMITPNRWQEGVSDVELLPVWVTNEGERLGLEQMQNQYPQLLLNDRALVRAIAAGKEEKVPLYLEDDRQRIDEEMAEEGRKMYDYKQSVEAVELFRSIELSTEDLRIAP